MLASSGEIGEPCGVPDSMSVTTPPSNTPARSQLRSSFNIDRSDTRRSMSDMSAPWSISSKHALMSASSTHMRPWLTAWRIVPSASCAERLGRNPKLTGEKSASKIGSSTILVAAIATRSRTVGMPSGRVCPGLPGLGICTRRSGAGRYELARTSAASTSRNSPTPEASMSLIV